MKDIAPPSGKRKRKKTPTVSSRKRASNPETAAGPGQLAKAKGAEAEMDIRLEAALRDWRLVEARRRGVPAFRILSDRTLRALATSHPVTTEDVARRPGNRVQHRGEVRNEYLPRAAREWRLNGWLKQPHSNA